MDNLIRITHASESPKYMQIIDGIIDNIQKGTLKKGDQLPSITELATSQSTAKVTIAKAYYILKERGIVRSQHGKGFFIASEKIKIKLNIFVLFDTMNAYKETLYKAFKSSLPADASCSIFFHHYDISQFEWLIKTNNGKYNFYVVMPHFDKDVSGILKQIPSHKLLLIDKNVARLEGNFMAVYQDFENDVIEALSGVLGRIKRYKSLSLIQGNKQFQHVPAEIINGFIRFCTVNRIRHKLSGQFNQKDIRQGNAYIIFSDADLIEFIKVCNRNKWKPGKDVGLISYDETPMKEFLANGITVLTTDFESMGRTAGEMIKKRLHQKVKNPCKMIIRKTL